jgi:hypothetical protein
MLPRALAVIAPSFMFTRLLFLPQLDFLAANSRRITPQIPGVARFSPEFKDSERLPKHSSGTPLVKHR